MKRLAFLLALLAVALPAAAPGAGCSPLDCAPSGTPIPGTSLLAVRTFGVRGPLRAVDLRDGSTRYRLGTGVLAGRRYLARVNGEREIAWYDASTGRAVARAATPDGWSLTGASVDGSRAVLVHVAVHHLHRFGILRADGRFHGIDLGRGDWP